MTPLLTTTEVSVRFGGLNAVDRVSLTVNEGRVVGLIGPNGAGKTTFVDTVTGFVKASSGTVAFDGMDVTGWTPHRRARLGMARTFQSMELFDDLSVRENLLVWAERPRWWAPIVDTIRPGRVDGEVVEAVSWALDVLGLDWAADAMPTELSHGERKLVGVARALAARPRLLLLDEPAAGLDTAESKVLSSQLRLLVGHGITVLLIDHDMGLVLGTCDDIFVLEFGSLIAHGTPAEVRTNPQVIAAYLGGQAQRATDDHGDGASEEGMDQ